MTKEDKIVLPKALQTKAVKYYPKTLCHPGETRTEITMAQHYTWKGMQNTVEAVCKYVLPSVPIEHTQAKSAWSSATKRSRGGTMGDTMYRSHWTLLIAGRTKKEPDMTLHCLTMIDPVTEWFELAEIPARAADVVMDTLEQKWLNRYPRPTMVVMDCGKEFMAEVRKTLKHDYWIQRKLITTRNPQANAMVEHAHQTLHSVLATKEIGQGVNPQERWEGIIAAVGFAMGATVRTSMRATPMQLVFGRDAIHNMWFQADWQYIKESRQKLIIQNNDRENARRTPHTYQQGDQVMILQHQHRKYVEPKYKGPYQIDRVNDNGTVCLRPPTISSRVEEIGCCERIFVVEIPCRILRESRILLLPQQVVTTTSVTTSYHRSKLSKQATVVRNNIDSSSSTQPRSKNGLNRSIASTTMGTTATSSNGGKIDELNTAAEMEVEEDTTTTELEEMHDDDEGNTRRVDLICYDAKMVLNKAEAQEVDGIQRSSLQKAAAGKKGPRTNGNTTQQH
jgi:hypothetical protein